MTGTGQATQTLAELTALALEQIADAEASDRARLAFRCGLIDKPTPEQDKVLRATMRGSAITLQSELRRFYVAFWRATPFARVMLTQLAAKGMALTT